MNRLLVMLLCAGLLPGMAWAKGSKKKSGKKSANALAAGMSASKVFIDPVTGRFVADPAPEVSSERDLFSPEVEKALSTSHQGLAVVPLEGGGYGIDLQGRFQSAMVAVVNPDGSVETKCISGSQTISSESQKKQQPKESSHEH